MEEQQAETTPPTDSPESGETQPPEESQATGEVESSSADRETETGRIEGWKQAASRLIERFWAPSSPRDNQHISALHQAYREAAAVLETFEMESLQPFRGDLSQGEESLFEGREDALQKLKADSILVESEEGPSRWMLMHPVRRGTLKGLQLRSDLGRALQANDLRPDTPIQRLLELAISRQFPRLETLSAEELSAAYRVAEWLNGIMDGIPEPSDIQALIDREALLQPLRYLVGTHFRGRQKELARLRQYVGVLPPGSPREAALRALHTAAEVFKLKDHPALLIFGPGGLGKSTLIANFILEHDSVEEELRFPWVYLDFDRPTLFAEEPLTLLLETVRQIGVQYPEYRLFCESLRKDWLVRINSPFASSSVQGSVSTPTVASPRTGKQSARQRRSAGETWPFLYEFRKLLEQLDLLRRPLLLVLDTFEEVQYTNRDSAALLFEVLNLLQAQVPRMRAVVAGRAQVPEFSPETLELTALDAEAAQGILEGHGINSALARTVVKKFGSNPLTIKLALRVLQSAGEAQLAAVQTERQVLGLFTERLEDAQVQGELYDRILDHIHDQRVKDLAHPGLVLRRITPEIILEVLAQLCQVQVEDLDAAREIFEEMEKEVALVALEEDGSLRHRADVRKIMLPLIQRKSQVPVEQIHLRAIQYYERQVGLTARAEEIYHRLCLEEPAERISGRWLPGIEPSLLPSMDELPPSVRTLLASLAGVDAALGVDAWRDADLPNWERRTEQRAQSLLQSGQAKEALAALRGRAERAPGNSLPLLEALALERLERLQEARAVVEKDVRESANNTDAERQLELLMLAARLDERLGDGAGAAKLLDAAYPLALSRGDDLRLLEIGLQRLRLRRGFSLPDALPPDTDIRIELSQTVGRLTDSILSANPITLQALGAEVGRDHPELLERLVRLGALSHIDWIHLDRLAASLAQLVEQSPSDAETTFLKLNHWLISQNTPGLPGTSASGSNLPGAGQDFWTNEDRSRRMTETFSLFLQKARVEEVGELFTSLLSIPELTAPVAAAVTESLVGAVNAAAGQSASTRQQIRSLAQQYERSLRKGLTVRARTPEMDEIADRLGSLPADASLFIPELAASASAGERLAAMVFLERKPEVSYLTWLADRLHEESPFGGRRAALALGAAARTLDRSLNPLVLAAIARAREGLHASRKDAGPLRKRGAGRGRILREAEDAISGRNLAPEAATDSMLQDVRWTNPMLKQLQSAFLAAFPTRSALERLVRYTMDLRLEDITDAFTLDSVVFDLLQWALANGSLSKLVSASLQSHSNNPQLQEFLETIRGDPVGESESTGA